MWYGEFSNLQIWLYATLLFISRYLLLAGGFYVIFYGVLKKRFKGFKIQRRVPGNVQLRQEILYSLLTFAIYGMGIWLFLYWIDQGMTRRYEYIETYGMLYFVGSVLLMIVLHDAYFYWTHRLIHHPGVFRFIHRTHHRFKAPTPWAAFAFHPLEALISMGIVPLIIFTMPFHQWALVCFISFMVLHNVLIHLGFQIKGFWFSRHQYTTLDHDYHHLKGHGNYGLYFNFWDRAMGTYRSTR